MSKLHLKKKKKFVEMEFLTYLSVTFLPSTQYKVDESSKVVPLNTVSSLFCGLFRVTGV